ncbi:Coatomer subunit zeta-1 [Rhizophlyctis rosea]|nr:Coatomer subunit zeta-1 [Rhizophlyctis rosea]
MTRTPLSLYTTKAVIILDNEGKRLLSKYYTEDYPTQKDQRAFESSLFKKTKKSTFSPNWQTAEILFFDTHIICYRNSIDTWIYVVGYLDDNELILSNLLSTISEVLTLLFGGAPPLAKPSQIEKSLILQNLDLVLLALDETLDDGIIFDLNPHDIVSRVTRMDGGAGGGDKNGPLTDQALMHTLKILDEQFGVRLDRFRG